MCQNNYGKNSEAKAKKLKDREYISHRCKVHNSQMQGTNEPLQHLTAEAFHARFKVITTPNI
jgi:hypothetical protein